MIDFHLHTASTHIRNDYASIDAYIDKQVRYKKNLYKKTTEIPTKKPSFIMYFVTNLIQFTQLF
jgi:hypothetical protein